ncbi:hypothetical protein BU14_0057s0007 [Porphyra umbilicalis]|uniref:Malectin domain-containing protein n=1 Tax=Porphyra umbilicalis TaxID=2786 RepID=A0A1X6PH47_PORUM|nr:hypothetical protein BU14_0057s0007 [Porphyra umbilicalis]|eukprot:OSX80187.1 hypothetical protein BU14_0057s0007 [Porphyra umbilicalis]
MPTPPRVALAAAAAAALLASAVATVGASTAASSVWHASASLPWAGFGAAAVARPPRSFPSTAAARVATRAAAGLSTRGRTPIATARRADRLAAVARQAAGAPNSLYIDCAGAGTSEFDGATWVPDTVDGFPADSRVHGAPEQTGLPTVLRTNRFSTRTMVYTRPVPAPSAYRITLHWAEIFQTDPGARLMDVFVAVDGGQPVALASFLDVYALVGRNTPYEIVYPPTGTPGVAVASTVTVTLQPSIWYTDNVFLSAFRIVDTVAPANETADATLITTLVNEAAATADSVVLTNTTHAEYVAAAAATAADVDAATAAAAAAIATAADPPSATVEAAYDNVKAAIAAVTAAAAPLSGDAYTAAAAAAAAAEAAVVAYADALSPAECLYLHGREGGVSVDQLDGLAALVATVGTAVAAVDARLAEEAAAADAVVAAVAALGRAVAALQAAVVAA